MTGVAARPIEQAELLLDDLRYPESPRWRDDGLWFSDMRDGVVRFLRGPGDAPVVLRVPGEPSGLGWLPDGRLLIVSMVDRKLLRREPDGSVTELADLSGFARFHLNDMLVSPSGTAYLGHYGFDFEHEEFQAASLVRVDPDGSSSVAVPDMAFPNGMALTGDGHTLIVAETWGHRLTAFDVDSDGTLSGRRVWAELPGRTPDGICLAEDGTVWLASTATKEVLRAAPGGDVLARIDMGSRNPLACTLGGPEGDVLYICSVGRRAEAQTGRTGQIHAVTVHDQNLTSDIGE